MLTPQESQKAVVVDIQASLEVTQDMVEVEVVAPETLTLHPKLRVDQVILMVEQGEKEEPAILVVAVVVQLKMMVAPTLARQVVPEELGRVIYWAQRVILLYLLMLQLEQEGP